MRRARRGERERRSRVHALGGGKLVIATDDVLTARGRAQPERLLRRPRVRRPRPPGAARPRRRGQLRASWSSCRCSGSSASTRAERVRRGLRRAGAGARPTHPRPGPLSGVPIAVKDEMDIGGEITSRGTGAITERAPRGLRGRAPAARRGRDRGRQDDDAGARAVAVHRVDHVGRDPQPVGHRPHAGRLERRLGGRGGRRARAGRGGRRRRRARSGSRPPAAGCSGSSRTRAACRARRTTATAATGSASAASRARCEDARADATT